jgi:hypothetical protein
MPALNHVSPFVGSALSFVYGLLPSSMRVYAGLMLRGNAYLHSLLVWCGLRAKTVRALSPMESLPDTILSNIASRTRYVDAVRCLYASV